MSHQATCHFCNVIACDVYSFHSLVAKEKRIGFDFYDCQNCKVHYIVKFYEDGRWKPIEKTTKTLEEVHKEFRMQEYELLERRWNKKKED